MFVCSARLFSQRTDPPLLCGGSLANSRANYKGTDMKEKTLKKKKIYAGKVFTLESHTISISKTKTSVRDIIKHPGAVAIIPILPDGKIVMVKQYRKAVEKNLYEIPAGTREPGERPLSCVKRELLEETGYVAKKISPLLRMYPAPGYTSEEIHIYAAHQLTLKEACPEEDESIEVEAFTPTKLKKMIKDGKIKDGKTVVGLLYLLK